MSSNHHRGGKRSRSMMATGTYSYSSPSSSAVLMLSVTALSIVSNTATAASFASSSSSAFATTPIVGAAAAAAAVVGNDGRFQMHLHLPPRHDDDIMRLSAKRRDHPPPPLDNNKDNLSVDKSTLEKNVATLCTAIGFSALFLTNPLIPHLPYSSLFSSAHAEDELYAKYGSRGLDASLVDKNCLANHCSLQAKACLRDDPDCRKGLACTAKCLGDNSCITGCFARYGNSNLDNLLKCTIEDHECIKVAILEGGADEYGREPSSPAPTVRNFDLKSMEGTWYKVAGYNPNYDCYACQRNTFSSPSPRTTMESENGNGGGAGIGGLFGAMIAGNNKDVDRLQVDVEFSMPRLLEDGSPPPPSGVRETFVANANAATTTGGRGLQSVGYNQYSTHETMVFDSVGEKGNIVGNIMKLGRKGKEKLYSRTAHSEGEMFGLKFWENWYIIGENDPYQDEFKFIYYNGKTRQNTYDGAFVYSRSRTLSPSSMEKVYQIAKDAGMNPDQFCKIQNNCFESDDGQSGLSSPAYVEREGLGSPTNPFRGILASTRISEILGVESVAAESIIPQTIADDYLLKQQSSQQQPASNNRPWWKEVGDYLEDPRRHFRLMDSLRTDMDWPEYIKQRY